MNVNDDWRLEMQRMLEVFERESTSSLRRISGCFVALGRPFNEDFRQYYLKMSTLRLDSSFNEILFERLNENRLQTPKTASETPHIYNEANSSMSLSPLGSLNVSENVMESKIEKHVDATIEITESEDDNSAEEHSGKRTTNNIVDNPLESYASKDTGETNDHPDDGQAGTDLNVGNDVVSLVKCEPKFEGEDETMDLPLQVFDPNEVNDSSSDGNGDDSVAGVLVDQGEAISPPSSQEQEKLNNGKRFKCKECTYSSKSNCDLQRHQLIHQGVKPFKCEVCDYAARRKEHLVRHQRAHEREKLMGIMRDPNGGLFKCTHCDKRFVKWNSLSKHLKCTHKNNQRLFNCMHCLRPFTQRAEKERHEIRCERRRFECYLCKNYVARYVSQMQSHMRTHSDARPFQCAICHRCFRHKNNLKYHLNSVHSRI